MESNKDNEEDSDDNKTNWAFVFMLLKNRNFYHEEILNLSYPQLNAYMNEISNPATYSITIPYMGSSVDETSDNNNENKNKQNKNNLNDKGVFSSKEELLSVVASMNQDFI